MVGAKRKLDTAHGLAAEGASQSTSNVSQQIHPRINPNLVVDAQSGRITRSAATQAGRTPRGNDKSQNSTTPSTTSTPSRRSRIIKLNTRGALPTNPSPSHVRETRTLRGRAAAAPSASSNKVESAAVQLPETPRVKRIKRGSVAEETPRSTRQSARIRHHQGISGLDEPADDKPLEPSPTKHSGSRGNIENQSHTDTALVETRSPSPREVASDVHQDSNSVDSLPRPDPEDPPTEEISDDSQHKVDSASSPDAAKPDLPPPSQADSQKHDSQETENDVAAANEEPPTPSNRKPKFEDADLDRALEQQLQNGTAEKHESLSTADATEESRADDESRQITDAEESSVANGVESTKSTANGPGGARAVAARNRAAKGKGRPRGKGVAGRRAAAGRGRQVDSPEFRTERSPSPFAAARKLLDRKSELDRAFKKVAAAQRLALHVMAVRTERQLARDKNAHRKVPEFEKVEAVLAAYRQKKQDSLRYEYECRIKQENLLFAAEQDRIEQRCRSSARYIQKEHLLAAQGDYMAFVEGRRAAEDDEHTETDGSDTESVKRPAAEPTKEFVRGFNSQSVRSPAGAAAYERAEKGWEHFVQRARLGEDIDPQMKEIGKTTGPAANNDNKPVGTLDLLLEASGIVANQQSAATNLPPEYPPPPPPHHHPHHHHPAMPATDAPAVALSALADVASTEAPIRTPRPSLMRPYLPQPMADPRYMLPRPAPPPPPPSRQQSQPQPQPLRPLISTGNEHFGLPNPFGPGSGPRQLPPPPGSNFQLPPPPGFLGSPPLYFPPPPRPPY